MRLFKNNFIKRYFLMLSFILISCLSCNSVLYTDTFDKNLDNWVIEQLPNGTVEIIEDQLDISQAKGAVVWYAKKLQAPVAIEYNVTVVDKGGSNDRVADMNCFWMANDPKSKEDFFKYSSERGGVFSKYFSHSLYYVGQGGHDNTKTRFRKYFGNGKRPVKPEHDLNSSEFLIQANKVNKIKILVKDSVTQYYCNGQLVYDIIDPDLYTSGYFGFRSYKNHLVIDNFVVTKL